VTDRWRIAGNLATLANGLLGVGAILYVLAGNPLWAMLLVVAAIGFDGLDGMLSRRSSLPPTAFGRVADSVADAVTFGLAPAFLLAVHTTNAPTWQPYDAVAVAVAGLYLVAALSRLAYFTARAYTRADFLGVPTPQSALALVVALLFHEIPAFQGVQPVGVLIGAIVLAALMVSPIPYPKIRRGAPLRWPMAATGVAAAIALTILQFRPAVGSLLYEVALVASYVLLVGVALYYLVGPFTVGRSPAPAGGH
jgi:CDP-diacylglycerol---serine O-phosphatidyltransferase